MDLFLLYISKKKRHIQHQCKIDISFYNGARFENRLYHQIQAYTLTLLHWAQKERYHFFFFFGISIMPLVLKVTELTFTIGEKVKFCQNMPTFNFLHHFCQKDYPHKKNHVIWGDVTSNDVSQYLTNLTHG